MWRLLVVFLLMVGIGVAIIVQAFRIQVVEGQRWRAIADSLTTRYRTIPAERGNIYADDGRLLATSLPYFEVRMDLGLPGMTDELFYDNVDSLAVSLAGLFRDRSASEYRQMLLTARKEKKRYQLIHRKVTFPELQKLKRFPLFRLGRYKGGLIVVKSNKRKIPFGILAHRTIGYVRTGPGAQSVGLEQYFNEYLAGQDGKRLMQRIAGGAWMPVNDRNEIESRNGDDLVTSLNVDIQDAAEYALLKALQKHEADHGCVIVMEVKTGRIKAMANLGRMENGSYWEKYNYAIGEGTEPGSTFKLATLAALLSDRFVTLTDSVDLENGRHRYYDRLMKDSEHHQYRKVSVSKAFLISSNVGISKLAYRYYADDPERFVKRLREFGLDKPVGITIRGEPKPLIKSPGNPGWSAVTIPWMSVGYEVRLTPLQILAFYNTVANGGNRMKPSLVTAIKRYGRTIQSFEPEAVAKNVFAPDVLEQLRALLKGVVDSGTARNIRTSDYAIAGKTGTAQIADRDQGYRQVYQSSFVGYFPADNPRYSIIVVITAPSKGVYYGSQVAAPVFREIADKIYSSSPDLFQADSLPDRLNTLHIDRGNEHDFEMIYKALDLPYQVHTAGRWAYTAFNNDSLILAPTRETPKGTVPNVLHMGLRDALYLLENEGLQVSVSGFGEVVQQSVPPGTPVRKGMRITIELK